MIMMRTLIALALAGGVVLAPALHAETAPDGEGNRYSFHSVDNGFIRLDGRTGQTSLCNQGASGWSCRAMADDRAAFEAEIARLQDENAALKKALLDHGLPLPGGVNGGVANPAGSVEPPKWPGSAELDRAFAFMGKVWRNLVDMMAAMQRDLRKS